MYKMFILYKMYNLTVITINLTRRWPFKSPNYRKGTRAHKRAETVTVANGNIPPSVHVSTLSFN